jgi:hypothetical protein
MTLSRSELNPPAHILGAQTPSTPLTVRLDRADWILAQRNAGVQLRDIADALGISMSSAARTYRPRLDPPPVSRRFSVTGIFRSETRKITTRADDKSAAEDRFRRAYPGAIVTKTERLGA